jgi:PAS domain S-box-containing protein
LILNVVPGYEETLGKVLVSIIDLTERRRMEEDLQAATKRLEHIITSNPALVYIAKPLPDLSDYYTIYQSKNTVSLIGFESEQLYGERGAVFWASRVHPDDLLIYRKETPKLWKEGRRSCEYRFRHKDGRYRWLREEAVVFRDADGKPFEIAGCWIDVTDLKAMEERLHQAERLAVIGETAAMVGHDLRNPLQAITTATYLLRDDSLTREDRTKMLQLIDDGVEYSNKIVSDLLDYSREIHLTFAVVKLRDITRTALQTVKVPESINVRDQIQEQTLITADPAMMRRVFVNLIANAVDAMPDGGDLTMSSNESNERVEITISDTGTGMASKVFETLWKPLQTTKAKGMGLGLPICKRIVEAHGGEISVESKPGEGATFTIRLPTEPKSNRG